MKSASHSLAAADARQQDKSALQDLASAAEVKQVDDVCWHFSCCKQVFFIFSGIIDKNALDKSRLVRCFVRSMVKTATSQNSDRSKISVKASSVTHTI